MCQADNSVVTVIYCKNSQEPKAFHIKADVTFLQAAILHQYTDHNSEVSLSGV